MMGLPLWSALLLLPATYLAWVVHRLTTNYSIAKRVGVPVVVIPVDPESPLWMLTSDYLGPFIDCVLSWIPYGSGSFTRYAHRGWDVHDKAKSFLELGDAFILVTTGKNWLYICNADTIMELLQRRKEFDRPVEIMGPPFGEPNMGLVWTECIRQANEMLDYWKGCPDIRQTGKDVRRFSLHVLTSTGFGKSYSFDRSTDEVSKEGGQLTYKDSLSLILENAILVMLLGPNLLTGSLQRFLPKHWRLVGRATNTFKKHIAESIKEEKELMAEGKANKGNFISAMVRASEEDARSYDPSTGQHSHGLSEKEIFGNIFVFNFAGHDSIAITLTYVITHLAAHPEIQDWIAAEINHVCKEQGATTYRDAFPRLRRCTAVVYETLRTSTPFPAVVKTTGFAQRSIKVNDKNLDLPPGMNIISTFPSMNAHPRHWGDDASTWRPSRWISTNQEDSSSEKESSIFDREILYTPPRGVFMPWSDGDRACPGKKFAQVELTGAVSALFKDYRVEPVPENGESMESARKRTVDVIEDSGMVLFD
ncbi:hypothetical protein G7Y89_g14859 [Cudoniella acicularis]|uniref:Cytochrome P450 n=1 Tax=Cudoniella acicularis TaxID=354080 RepID=A0A8H4VQU9_9HELO|nr:hypothetical protein G7Y89_g14859 [Cudoniella acicularis]